MARALFARFAGVTAIFCGAVACTAPLGLPRKYGTRELPALGTVIEDVSGILPGDILNKPAGHVLLFVGFADATRTTLKVIEAGAWDGRAWKVVESEYAIDRLTHDGFVPLRDKRRSPGT